MSDLLTTEEYGAIAQSLRLPQNAFIDGAFRPAISGQRLATVNPATGQTLAGIAACGPEDVDLAVARARDAFEDGRWSRLAPGARKEVLLRLVRLLRQNARELAVMESLDSGKTIRDCETVDLPETIHVLQWHAELIDKVHDQVAPASDDHISMILREPVGVVGLDPRVRVGPLVGEAISPRSAAIWTRPGAIGSCWEGASLPPGWSSRRSSKRRATASLPATRSSARS